MRLTQTMILAGTAWLFAYAPPQAASLHQMSIAEADEALPVKAAARRCLKRDGRRVCRVAHADKRRQASRNRGENHALPPNMGPGIGSGL